MGPAGQEVSHTEHCQRDNLGEIQCWMCRSSCWPLQPPCSPQHHRMRTELWQRQCWEQNPLCQPSPHHRLGMLPSAAARLDTLPRSSLRKPP